MTYIGTDLATQENIAKNIQKYLELTGQSQTSLCETLGKDRQYINQILKLKSCPSLEMLDQIAEAMDCEVRDLVTKNYFDQFKAVLVKKK